MGEEHLDDSERSYLADLARALQIKLYGCGDEAEASYYQILASLTSAHKRGYDHRKKVGVLDATDVDGDSA